MLLVSKMSPQLFYGSTDPCRTLMSTFGGLPGTLGMIVLAGVLPPRCGPSLVLVGAAVSMICGWLITFSSEIFGEPRGISFMWIIPAGCVSGLLVTAITSSDPTHEVLEKRRALLQRKGRAFFVKIRIIVFQSKKPIEP